MNVKTVLFAVCLAALVVADSGCRKQVEVAAPAIPSVTVSQPISEPVTEYLDLTGSVAASKSVDLVARVTGRLESVDFSDGDYVKEGQLLFTIEPDVYQQQLALNQAALVQAQKAYDRQLQLHGQSAISNSDLDQAKSVRDQADAQVKLAAINLGYAQVKAPFSGRIGRRQVDVGNLVGAGAPTKLATIEQLLPIYANFSLSERDALTLRERLREAGRQDKGGVSKTPVFVGLQTEDGYPHQGILDFVDNDVSTSTGTVALRAMLKNEDRTLFPGLFARVRIPVGEPKPMLVIPNRAIANDQQGDYVLVVEAGNVVARRSIIKGPLTPGGCAITNGLTAQDRVIIDGILSAKIGGKVAPVEANAAGAPKGQP